MVCDGMPGGTIAALRWDSTITMDSHEGGIHRACGGNHRIDGSHGIPSKLMARLAADGCHRIPRCAINMAAIGWLPCKPIDEHAAGCHAHPPITIDMAATHAHPVPSTRLPSTSNLHADHYSTQQHRHKPSQANDQPNEPFPLTSYSFIVPHYQMQLRTRLQLMSIQV